MKYTFPRSALPVLRILRRDVPRPKTLPKMNRGSLDWKWVCPMGMHPEARNEMPDSIEEFPLASARAVTAFYLRWDTFTDAQAAMDAVWPIKRKAGK